MSVFRAVRNRSLGPSGRTKAWVEFIEMHADWFIDARKRWHEGDPQPRAYSLHARIGTVVGLVASVLAVAHFVS